MIRIAAAGALCLSAGLSSGEVFFGTYTPSQAAPSVQSGPNEPWGYEIRPQDGAAQASSSGDFDGSYALINVFGTNFSRNRLYQEFVALTSFTASHIQLAVSRTVGATDTLMALSVQRWNETTASWENLYGNFGGARIRAAGIPGGGGVVDLTVAFGNNQTGAASGFSSTPAEIVAGERYRLVMSHSAGAVGGLNWHFSNVASATDAVGLDGDPATGDGTSTYYNGFDANAFVGFSGVHQNQFAFAFTDGDPIPGPGVFGVAAAAGLFAGRRRRAG